MPDNFKVEPTLEDISIAESQFSSTMPYSEDYPVVQWDPKSEGQPKLI